MRRNRCRLVGRHVLIMEQISAIIFLITSGTWTRDGADCKNAYNYTVSLTKLSVPSEDEIRSDTRWLCVLCTSSNSSRPFFSSLLVIKTSACNRRNTLMVASIASKSRCVWSLRTSACMNTFRLCNDVKDRSSSSSAAGCSILTWWKNPSSITLY